jgi:hypothetical protein
MTVAGNWASAPPYAVDPGYFGSAWVALGRIMLATSLLGECPDNGGRFLHRDG